jgi:hypothetical protein
VYTACYLGLLSEVSDVPSMMQALQYKSSCDVCGMHMLDCHRPDVWFEDNRLVCLVCCWCKLLVKALWLFP